VEGYEVKQADVKHHVFFVCGNSSEVTARFGAFELLKNVQLKQ
jgi:hypothetical protein